MTKDEFSILVATMKSVYTSERFIPDEYAGEVWWRMLNDLDYKLAMAALQRHMSISEFPPTIASIREGCVKLSMGEQKDWSEGWNKALRLVGKYGYMQEDKAMRELKAFDPVAAKAVEMLGWKQLCESPSDDISFRSNFRTVYQTAQKRTEELAKIPVAVRDMLTGTTGEMKMIGGADQ